MIVALIVCMLIGPGLYMMTTGSVLWLHSSVHGGDLDWTRAIEEGGSNLQPQMKGCEPEDRIRIWKLW